MAKHAPTSTPKARLSPLAIIGPGLLIAATGVGAGDLATAGISGSKLGVAVAWAIVLGAFFKFVLTEGLARWQLATGESILHGALTRLGWPVRIAFGLYLIPFSFVVGRALMAACGITAQSLVPALGDSGWSLFWLAIGHSALAILLLRLSGYRFFERVMAGCIATMFVTVIASAVLIRPDWPALAQGLVVPRVPDLSGEGLQWTVGLVGGVGGTLTVLCYGYWIRERGRTTPDDVSVCRVDLGVGYAATALFGIAALVIAAGVPIEGKGAKLIINLADSLGERLHPGARIAFLVGAWATVFSSLLGVWQAVPYIFADYWNILKRSPREGDLTETGAYRAWQWGIAIVPAAALLPIGAGWIDASFEGVQLAYAITGAVFLPLLAVVLLLLNGRTSEVGLLRNRLSVVALVLVLVFFAWAGVTKIRQSVGATSLVPAGSAPSQPEAPAEERAP